MNMNEQDFAYKVRHALNERLEDLPENISARLADARSMAVKRKKKSRPLYVSLFQQMLQALLPVRRDMFHGQAVWGSPCPFWCWSSVWPVFSIMNSSGRSGKSQISILPCSRMNCLRPHMPIMDSGHILSTGPESD